MLRYRMVKVQSATQISLQLSICKRLTEMIAIGSTTLIHFQHSLAFICPFIDIKDIQDRRYVMNFLVLSYTLNCN